MPENIPVTINEQPSTTGIEGASPTFIDSDLENIYELKYLQTLIQ